MLNAGSATWVCLRQMRRNYKRMAVMMMDDDDGVKAAREFHTNKDMGVNAQVEGVKWLLSASLSLPTLENDKQAYAAKK